jgi:hypothetical protein
MSHQSLGYFGDGCYAGHKHDSDSSTGVKMKRENPSASRCARVFADNFVGTFQG